MTINGKTYNLVLEMEIKGIEDADAFLPAQSHNPVYMKAYNETMDLNGTQTAEHNLAPYTDNPVYMKAYNETMTDIMNGDRCFSEYAKKHTSSF